MKIQILAFILFLFVKINIVSSQPLSVSVATTTPLCQMTDTNGVLTATVIGGTPPYTYSWNGGSTQNSTAIAIGNILTNAGHYYPYYGNNNFLNEVYLSVTDFNGQTASWAGNIGNVINATDSVVDAICPQQGKIFVNSIIGGNAPYSGSLVYNNSQIATGISSFTNLLPGVYELTLTDFSGCNFVFKDSIFQSSGISINGSQSNTTCSTSTLSLNVIGGIAPYTYVWTNNPSNSNTAQVNTNVYASYTVSDSQGCSQTNSFYVAQPYYIQANQVVAGATCPLNNGSIQLFPSGGVAPYSCTWNNGSTGLHLTNLNDGQYQGVIYDANGCFTASSIYVQNITPIYVNFTSVNSDCLTPTGSATLQLTGGTAPYNITWNTLPPQSGLSINNVNSGNYGFQIIDANGCLEGGNVSIGSSNGIYLNFNVVPTVCGQSTGSVTTLAYCTLPITYSWNNGQTTSTLSQLSGGFYTCTVTNSIGCSASVGGYVGVSPSFSVSSNVTNASCIYTADGSISLSFNGGVPPYTVTWSNGTSGQIINNLIEGRYYYSVYDANGCVYYHFADVGSNSTSPCSCTISGVVYHDANSNCVIDANENKVSALIELIKPNGNEYYASNLLGNYSFSVPSGSYKIIQHKWGYYGSSACQNDTLSFTAAASANCNIVNNFADSAQSISDLQTIMLSQSPAVVGYGYSQRIAVANVGTVNVNDAMIDLKASNYGTISSTTFAGNNTSANNWTYSSIPALTPQHSFSIDNQYNISQNTPSGISLLYSDTAYRASVPWLNDETPANNVGNLGTQTVSSYDPNLIEVSPQGWGANGNIYPPSGDSILTYTVHFQNSGNYYAINVEVVDSLSSHLDLSTLQMIYGTHNYETTIDENHVLHVKFNNIFLPWESQFGYNGSSGAFVYKVKVKSNTSIGDVITNKAAIFFDFNPAIITNTASNLVYLGIEPNLINDFTVYPNPTKDKLIIATKTQTIEGTLSIYNLIGDVVDFRNVSSKSNYYEVNGLSKLTAGIYFVQLRNNKGIESTIKFVKE